LFKPNSSFKLIFMVIYRPFSFLCKIDMLQTPVYQRLQINKKPILL